MKKERLFIFWLLAIIIASVLLIFLKPQQTINNVIQAIAIITLVFVTWVYSKRTKDLVEQEKNSLEEEKKKRYAEFGERRNNELLYPLGWLLIKLSAQLKLGPPNIEKAEKILFEFMKLHYKNAYLSTKKLNSNILKFRDELKKELEKAKSFENKELLSWKDKALVKVDEIHKKIDKEFNIIMKHLRKTYRY